MTTYKLPYSNEYATHLVEAFATRSPAAHCAVINCNNSANQNNENVKFYTFPTDSLERTIWAHLLGRVDKQGRHWQVPRSKLLFVCSEHFLGRRRLLLPETDHFYPSIFPVITVEHCLPNVSCEEQKYARFPRPAGFYKHKRQSQQVIENGGQAILIYREPLPELDADGTKWSQLEDIAYTEIYVPFATIFNKMISEFCTQDGNIRSKIEEITQHMDALRIQMRSSLHRMLRANEQQLSKTEVNIYNTAQGYPKTLDFGDTEILHSIEKPAETTRIHSYVFGPDNIRIPIDVSMPSIFKDWTFTKLKFLRAGQRVFAYDGRRSESWVPSIVLDVNYTNSTVRVKNAGGNRERVVTLSDVAYGLPATGQIQLGCRVLALHVNSPHAGVVMEYPKWQNNNRYLILFENGLWAYNDQRTLYLICKQTSQAWLHISGEVSQFVKEFFMTTEHPLLRVTIGQKIQAERDKQWFEAEVLALDGNLIKVAFKHYGSKFATEWLYAGSARLQDIFSLLNSSHNDTRKHAKRKIGRKPNEPYVEYTDDAMDVITLSDDEECEEDEAPQQKKNTARKSTASSQPTATRKKSAKAALEKDPGFLGSVLKEYIEPLAKGKAFVEHSCGKSCLPLNDDPLKHTDRSPYLLPHLMGWKRLVVDSSEGKNVIYRTPCGRSVRNATETLYYILITGSNIRIDQFCFDTDFNMYAVWKPKFSHTFISDVTNGQEPYPVSLVNGVDTTEAELVPYWSKRRPTKAAKRTMNLDTEFLPCCSCEDECLDRSRCQCQQQTVASSDSISGEADEKAGYTFKSLSANQITGIYECNSRCSCNAQCINKVAQHGVQVRLQIFKTLKKGYGVRTLHDIPKGRFLCTYAGTVLTDKEAETRGQDTYFAELDYLDIIALSKEGYESSVSDIEDDLFDLEDLRHGAVHNRMDGDTLRKLYFDKEDSYVMDALKGGNIGRYFNHSCDPNIFVQNVFVDTHDLRLPWIGFFTDRLIKAGEELTWDYRYEVGSVKGRKLLCYCNSANCRKRLL